MSDETIMTFNKNSKGRFQVTPKPIISKDAHSNCLKNLDSKMVNISMKEKADLDLSDQDKNIEEILYRRSPKSNNVTTKNLKGTHEQMTKSSEEQKYIDEKDTLLTIDEKNNDYEKMNGELIENNKTSEVIKKQNSKIKKSIVIPKASAFSKCLSKSSVDMNENKENTDQSIYSLPGKNNEIKEEDDKNNQEYIRNISEKEKKPLIIVSNSNNSKSLNNSLNKDKGVNIYNNLNDPDENNKKSKNLSNIQILEKNDLKLEKLDNDDSVKTIIITKKEKYKDFIKKEEKDSNYFNIYKSNSELLKDTENKCSGFNFRNIQSKRKQKNLSCPVFIDNSSIYSSSDNEKSNNILNVKETRTPIRSSILNLGTNKNIDSKNILVDSDFKLINNESIEISKNDSFDKDCNFLLLIFKNIQNFYFNKTNILQLSRINNLDKNFDQKKLNLHKRRTIFVNNNNSVNKNRLDNLNENFNEKKLNIKKRKTTFLNTNPTINIDKLDDLMENTKEKKLNVKKRRTIFVNTNMPNKVDRTKSIEENEIPLKINTYQDSNVDLKNKYLYKDEIKNNESQLIINNMIDENKNKFDFLVNVVNLFFNLNEKLEKEENCSEECNQFILQFFRISFIEKILNFPFEILIKNLVKYFLIKLEMFLILLYDYNQEEKLYEKYTQVFIESFKSIMKNFIYLMNLLLLSKDKLIDLIESDCIDNFENLIIEKCSIFELEFLKKSERIYKDMQLQNFNIHERIKSLSRFHSNDLIRELYFESFSNRMTFDHLNLNKFYLNNICFGVNFNNEKFMEFINDGKIDFTLENYDRKLVSTRLKLEGYSESNINNDEYLKENLQTNLNFSPIKKLNKKFTLVLDLDETLLHFQFSNQTYDNNYYNSDGVLHFRPGLSEFLESIYKYYDLIVFTLGTKDVNYNLFFLNLFLLFQN